MHQTARLSSEVFERCSVLHTLFTRKLSQRVPIRLKPRQDLADDNVAIRANLLCRCSSLVGDHFQLCPPRANLDSNTPFRERNAVTRVTCCRDGCRGNFVSGSYLAFQELFEPGLARDKERRAMNLDQAFALEMGEQSRNR
jgi:hypothetical protein